MKIARWCVLLGLVCGCASSIPSGKYQHYDHKTGKLKDGPAWEDPKVLNYQPPPPPTIELIREATHSDTPPKDLQFMLPDETFLDMVGIGKGSFVMGISIPRASCLAWGEKTVQVENRVNTKIGHKVTLTQDYWIGRYEVSQRQYCAVMGRRQFTTQDEDCPATGITWEDARKYCKKLNELFSTQLPQGYVFDLPSEAQWEYACKAGATTELNNGLNIETYDSDGYRLYVTNSPSVNLVAWYAGNSSGVVHPVGEKVPNQWGLYDMHGNAAEWCLDYACRYDETNYIDPLFVDQAVGSGIWKQRALTRKARTIRGGSFKDPSFSIPCATKELGADSQGSLLVKINEVGFRVALVPVRSSPTLVDSDMRVYGISPYEVKCRIKGRTEAYKTRELLSMQNERKWNTFVKCLEIALLACETAVNTYAAVEGIRSGTTVSGAGEACGDAGGGFGTIQGPASLAEGKSASYKLYVGGKRIDSGVSWSTSTSCLIVSGHGSYANVMAKNPPVKSGSTKAQLRATYNGKTYSKWITVQKTGIFAAGN